MLSSIQLSTSICVRARVNLWPAQRKKGRKDEGDRDGEHLIAACNAVEGDGGGEQALDEVLAIAPFLVLRRYLILNLSW